MDSTYATHQVETGWKARLLTRFPAWTIPVRIMSDIRKEASVRKRSSLRLCIEFKDIEQCLFRFICNTANEYEIFDASSKAVAGSPTIPKDQDHAIDYVLDILEHMAEFKRFEGIQNRVPDTLFERSFKLISSDHETRAAGDLDVNHRDEWHFTVENLGDKPIYLTIFNLRPSGQIKNLMAESAIDFLVIEPKDEQTGSVRMEVPETLIHQGYREREGVMKFFIASRATCFPAGATKLSPFRQNA